MSFDFVDLFCGAGGSIDGLVAAGGRLVLGANHWERAIETVSTNHPDADYLQADINNYDMAGNAVPCNVAQWIGSTYSRGVFWKRYRPEKLTTHDLRLDGVDFRNLPPDGMFDAAVIDGPYKLNGTSSKPDIRYGVDTYDGWQGRHRLIREGITECARVTVPGGYVLVKCQAQVCGGAIRWQDREFADHGEGLGLTLVDRFDLLGKGRAQPERTRKDGTPSRQHHAYGRPSTLLILRTPRRRRP